jgi:hypothetical protein
LKRLVKSRVLGLLAIERSRARQQSRMTWIKKGDANMRYFQIMENSRGKNNFIEVLNDGIVSATSQSDKHQLIFQHFQAHLGSSSQRNHMLNFVELGWEPQQLHYLNLPFSEQEVERVIKALPKQKAPRPDGFIGTFFRTCWNIIKVDCIAALQQFYNMNQQGLQFLNQALVILLPKQPNAEKITKLRPISLIHFFFKAHF